MKIKYLIPAFTALVLLTSVSKCDFYGTNNEGILEGKITIGPLCPVEKDPPDPDCLPTRETYEAYPVSIWTSSGKKKITVLNPSLDGKYSVSLNPGEYLLNLETSGYGPGGSNLPAYVTIIPDQTTSFDIDIDTGIR